MEENTFRENSPKGKKKPRKKNGKSINNPFNDRRFQLTFGLFLVALALFFLVAFLSYIFTWKADQSVVEAFSNESLVESGLEIRNWLGLYGALTSHYFMFNWFGLAAFFIPPIVMMDAKQSILHEQDSW